MTEALANNIQSDTSAQSERERRQRVLKKGIVSYNNGSITSEVIVRDLSSQGVKLKQSSQIPLPDHFVLEIPMDGIKVECQVRWRSNGIMGVLFLEEPQIRQETQRAQMSAMTRPTGGPTLRKRPIT